MANLSGHRNGSHNPWNVDPWPAWDPPGSLPKDDGDLFPSARFWVWYTSGAPRAATPAQQDSGLGQAGPDPCGVVPASFYSMAAASYSPADRPAWNPTNLSIDKWLRAFDTFGPRGTKAMFNHPPGYLEQFAAERDAAVGSADAGCDGQLDRARDANLPAGERGGGGDSAGSSPVIDGGCGCAVPAARRGAGAPLFFLFLVSLAVARCRSRR